MEFLGNNGDTVQSENKLSPDHRIQSAKTRIIQKDLFAGNTSFYKIFFENGRFIVVLRTVIPTDQYIIYFSGLI